MYDSGDGSPPLYQMVEEYANDQDIWVRDFLLSIRKMQANGYGEGDPNSTKGITRQILGSQDFPENHQKTLFATFSDAAEKPSKNPKKPSAAPGNFEKPLKNLPAAPQNHQKTVPGYIFMSLGL